MLNRREFLGSMLAACVAPAIVRADSLMRIVPRETVLLSAFDISQFADAGGLIKMLGAGLYGYSFGGIIRPENVLTV